MFPFNEEHLSIRDLVRDFAQNEVLPTAEENDKRGTPNKKLIHAMADMGLLTLNVPEIYGGAGADEMTKVQAIIEMGRCCAGTAEVLSTQMLVNDILLANANEEQKAKYLPLSNEGKLGAFALTEPGAGSDAGSIRTRAIQDGDDFIINGTKCFISNMGEDEGEYVIVITVTDPEKGTRGGMTAFIVERGTPGFEVGKTEDKMGIRCAAVSELIFTDCRVPASQVLGKVGEGFRIAMSGLDGGRIGISALSLGIAQSAMDAAVKYSKERAQFGKPIAANQGLRWYIADMATRLEASRLLCYQAVDARMKGSRELTKLAAMSKYYCSETANYIADMAVQIHGGYGFIKDFAVERIYRDARILKIFEGTSEIQKIVISREVMK